MLVQQRKPIDIKSWPIVSKMLIKKQTHYNTCYVLIKKTLVCHLQVFVTIIQPKVGYNKVGIQDEILSSSR